MTMRSEYKKENKKVGLKNRRRKVEKVKKVKRD